MQIIDSAEMERMISRMAYEIVEKCKTMDQVALVGIQRRGVPLAQRLLQKIEAMEGSKPLSGILDITLYRDDLSLIATHPVINGTDIPFPVDGKTIFLIDDVLYTGRTTRCAMEALMEMGRPAAIRLGVLIDRGHRELPIGADVVGRILPTSQSEIIHVNLPEIDGAENISIEKKTKPGEA